MASHLMNEAQCQVKNLIYTNFKILSSLEQTYFNQAFKRSYQTGMFYGLPKFINQKTWILSNLSNCLKKWNIYWNCIKMGGLSPSKFDSIVSITPQKLISISTRSSQFKNSTNQQTFHSRCSEDVYIYWHKSCHNNNISLVCWQQKYLTNKIFI